MIIKRIVLLSALPLAISSAFAADKNNQTMIVTANLFPQPVSSVLAPVTVVTREDIERSQAQSVTDVLKRLPGVDIVQNGGRGQTTSLFVRGTTEGQTLVLINGVRSGVASITGYKNINQIPLSIVQRIEYIRGSRSAVYGSEAIGGVINIITQGDDEKTGIEVGTGSHEYQYYDAHVHQKITDNTTITLVGSFEQTKGFNVQPNSTAPEDKDKDGFRSRSVYGEIEQRFSDNWRGFLRSYGYGNYSEYDVGSNSSGSNDKRSLYSRNYDSGVYFSEGSFNSQLILSYQNSNDLNYGGDKSESYKYPTVNKLSQRSLQWGNVYAFDNGLSVSAGLDWRKDMLDKPTDNGFGRRERDNTGLYLTANQQISDFTLEGAIRTDDNQQFGRYNTWQSALGWQFLENYQATLSYGTAFNAPTFGQLYGQYGTPNLKPEESKQWEIGLEKMGIVNWRLSAYRNRISNNILYDSTQNWKPYNIGQALIKGIEWELSFDTGSVEHRIDIEYMKPQNLVSGKDLARRPRQKLKYQLDWTLFNIDFGLAYRFSGKSYDDASGKRERLSSYSTIDFTSAYQFTKSFTLRAKISNLFDKDYETAKGYATAGREFYITGSYQF